MLRIWQSINEFADQPIGKLLVGAFFQFAVIGAIATIANHVVSESNRVAESAERARLEVIQIGNDLSEKAEAFFYAASAASNALMAARPDTFLQIMEEKYEPAMDSWTASSQQILKRWHTVFSEIDCSKNHSLPCDAIHAWLSAYGNLKSDKIWSIHRRIWIINNQLNGEGGYHGIRPTEWFRCRNNSQRALAFRENACRSLSASSGAQFSDVVTCLNDAWRDWVNYNDGHCDYRPEPDGTLVGREKRTILICLISNIDYSDRYTGEDCKSRPALKRKTNSEHYTAYDLSGISLNTAIANASEQMQVAANFAYNNTCKTMHQDLVSWVRAFVRQCEI